VFTQKEFPADWAMAHFNLGFAYFQLSTGDRAVTLTLDNTYSQFSTSDRAGNLTRALTAYQAALLVYTEKDFPGEWAKTQNDIGIVFVSLPIGGRAENLKQAKASFLNALRIWRPETFFEDHLVTMGNLRRVEAELAALNKDF